ncbi:MAG TPA: winged helix-turn-helix domain-containing protein [Dermatophilaceae bacterium]|nr:winged helix-turn-helix domain-containing protein [Dermatophilaceae bacterium]
MAKDSAATTKGTTKRTRKATIKETTLTLTDPRAIRAIAHEARQQVIDELYSGSVLTATEAARICGLSPSAMSYHLRALEKWGIVMRDDTSSDGRERPWRATARSLSLGRSDADSGASVRQAARAVMSTFMVGLNTAVETWLETEPRAKGAQASRSRIFLTDDEAAALNGELDALVQRYDNGRTSHDKPDAATPRDQYWLLFPHVSQPSRRIAGRRSTE